MATKLTKPISRETQVIPQSFGKHRGKPLIITLDPSLNHITFRIKGTRQECSTHIATAYRVAQKQALDAEYKQKLADYKAGRRKRKPTKPYLPLSI